MSRKTVAFPVPSPATKQPTARRSRATPDSWVSRSEPAAPPQEEPEKAPPRGFELVIDLAADRSLVQVMALAVFVPFALGWFWLTNALNDRLRR